MKRRNGTGGHKQDERMLCAPNRSRVDLDCNFWGRYRFGIQSSFQSIFQTYRASVAFLNAQFWKDLQKRIVTNEYQSLVSSHNKN